MSFFPAAGFFAAARNNKKLFKAADRAAEYHPEPPLPPAKDLRAEG